MDDSLKFGYILRVSRKNSHFRSLENLAQEIGITRQTLGNYENGSRLPDIDILVKLAGALDVSTDFLLGLSSDPIKKKLYKSSHPYYPSELQEHIDMPWWEIFSDSMYYQEFCEILSGYCQNSDSSHVNSTEQLQYLPKVELNDVVLKAIIQDYFWKMVDEHKEGNNHGEN